MNYLSFCLSMYRCSLWSLSCKNVHIIECALNKIIIFRRAWNLPSFSHTRIVHCVSNISVRFKFCNVSIPCYQVLNHPYHLSLDVSSVTLPSVGIPLLVTIFSTVIDI